MQYTPTLYRIRPVDLSGHSHGLVQQLHKWSSPQGGDTKFGQKLLLADTLPEGASIDLRPTFILWGSLYDGFRRLGHQLLAANPM
jgi:hypothetical protein